VVGFRVIRTVQQAGTPHPLSVPPHEDEVVRGVPATASSLPPPERVGGVPPPTPHLSHQSVSDGGSTGTEGAGEGGRSQPTLFEARR